jgi:hypothetical protein
VVAAPDTEDARTMAAVGDDIRVSRADLATAIRVLRALRDSFESDRWRA